MYQCQMAKQTMGHSCYTWHNRSDAKAYRLLTPQSSLVRTKTYVKYDLDHYPLGFNAIVAVMSYTVSDAYAKLFPFLMRYKEASGKTLN